MRNDKLPLSGKRGVIVPSCIVSCGDCGCRIKSADGLLITEATVEFRSLGWVRSPGPGWLCPKCKDIRNQ